MDVNENKSTVLKRIFDRRDRSGRQEYARIDQAQTGILPGESFREELEKEMMRADRVKAPLTLLLFDIEEKARLSGLSHADIGELLSEIGDTMRKTDCKGWYGDGRGAKLGVLLPHTSPQRADRIIKAVGQRYREFVFLKRRSLQLGLEIGCEIYAYPNEQDSFGDRIRQLDLFDEESTPTNGGGNGSGHAIGKAHSSPQAGARMSSIYHSLNRSTIRSAELLLTRPVPGWKRTMDIVLGGVGLAILSPIFLAITLVIKLTSPGPIFFRQERVGHGGRIFKCWKFRSMRHGYDCTAHKNHLKNLIASASSATGDEKPMVKLDSNNPHINRFGRFIRSTHLDELPQLFNVIRGEMSLVGPRPCIPYEAESYQQWCRRRFDILPGITGLWQVKGKNKTTFNQMIRLDINYIRRCSWWLDLKIIFMTFYTIVEDVRGK